MNIYVRNQDNDLCKYLSQEQSERLLALGEVRSCPAALTILPQGVQPQGFIMLLSGELEVRDAENHSLERIFPGEIYGEIAFMGVSISNHSITSIKASSYHLLPFTQVEELIVIDHDLAARIMAAINDSLCLKTIHLTHHRNHG